MKVQTDVMCDFLFADDYELNANSQAEMQESFELFTAAWTDFGLTVSTKKIEVMSKPAPYTDPTVKVAVKSQLLLICSPILEALY